MIDQVSITLGDISASLRRIEQKLDASVAQFDQHVMDDALLAHDVRMLARKQRGYFLSGFAAVGAGIAAAAGYAIKRLTFGHQ